MRRNNKKAFALTVFPGTEDSFTSSSHRPAFLRSGFLQQRLIQSSSFGLVHSSGTGSLVARKYGLSIDHSLAL